MDSKNDNHNNGFGFPIKNFTDIESTFSINKSKSLYNFASKQNLNESDNLFLSSESGLNFDKKTFYKIDTSNTFKNTFTPIGNNVTNQIYCNMIEEENSISKKLLQNNETNNQKKRCIRNICFGDNNKLKINKDTNPEVVTKRPELTLTYIQDLIIR